MDDPLDAASDPADPADEIEITPEMIEAGAEVIWRRLFDVFAYDSAQARWLAEAVFQAMAAARRGSVISAKPSP